MNPVTWEALRGESAIELRTFKPLRPSYSLTPEFPDRPFLSLPPRHVLSSWQFR